jgi:cytochrome d ubiquinol oxidase subunit I
MMSEMVVNLSRLQFALTAMYHFLFVPLTLGLAIILGIMETVYVMTDNPIWKRMTQFWGKLFAINFAMGVATGITMEFQFGTNWAYYSHYVGDIFGVPLAIEGLMAFFLESTFVGLFIFGWDRLSKRQHLCVTWLTALGANLSALWILIANGWMQNPTGAFFNPDTMRMELTSIKEVIFNEVAQAKFVHTVSAGYVTGAIFVMAVSAWYLLNHRNIDLAKRSLAVAASFGLASALSVVVLGDESGYSTTLNQKAKLAAIEAMWETEPAPAGFTVFGIPDQTNHVTHYEVKIPYVLGIIATRTLTETLPGIKDLIKNAENRIKTGLKTYTALDTLRSDRSNQQARDAVKEGYKDLGYALLLKRYRQDILNATPEEISKAAQDVIPSVAPLYWSFRIMVGLGLFFIFLFGSAFYMISIRRQISPWLLKLAFFSLPTPWIAAELGWFVAEYGRQPWAIEGILPTFLGVSSVSLTQILLSLSGFVIFYTALLVIDVMLMIKYIRLGPGILVPHTKQGEISHVS